MADDSPGRLVPKPPGAADTLLEAGEEPTDLSLTLRAEGDSPGGALGPMGARKERKLMFYDVGHSAPPTNRPA
ncbi:hypothetical protein [Streptomyces mirabilis]|uniref:hypothetical protein n=1 Tax=Streptomyces mirabilis TaxID=68239 RepID=UPI0033BDD219